MISFCGFTTYKQSALKKITIEHRGSKFLNQTDYFGDLISRIPKFTSSKYRSGISGKDREWIKLN